MTFYDYLEAKNDFITVEKLKKITEVIKKIINENVKVLVIHHYDLDGFGCKYVFKYLFRELDVIDKLTFVKVNTKANDVEEIVDFNEYDYIFVLDCTYDNTKDNSINESKTILIDHHNSAYDLINNTNYITTCITKNKEISASAMCFLILSQVIYKMSEYIEQFSDEVLYLIHTINGWDTYQWKNLDVNSEDNKTYDLAIGYKYSEAMNKTFLLFGLEGFELFVENAISDSAFTSYQLPYLCTHFATIMDKQLDNKFKEFKDTVIYLTTEYKEEELSIALGFAPIEYTSLFSDRIRKETSNIDIFVCVDFAKLKVGLRTANTKIDLSEIATGLGGGGHTAAAGFNIDISYHTDIADSLNQWISEL